MKNGDDNAILAGMSEQHLSILCGHPSSQFKIHHRARDDFEKLCRVARKDGIEIWPVSIFRSFERQMQIWNGKATGQMALLNERGFPLEYADCSEEEIVRAILRWSALPGLSRHHWGTDVDVIDANSLPSPDYQVQLIPAEYRQNGPFCVLNRWLEQKIMENQSFGFFRPYQRDLGGVAPEPWHLSYAPVAENLLGKLSFEFFENLITSEIYQQVELREVIFNLREEIYSRYISNIFRPDWLSV